MKTIADRFNQVRETRRTDDGDPWTWSDWAKAIEVAGGRVSKSTLTAIGRGEILNPSPRVIRDAALGASVSYLWLLDGFGRADDLELPPDDDLPDRKAVIEICHARGVSKRVIDKILAIDMRGDLATWMLIAAKLIQEDEAPHDKGRVRRGR